MALKGYRAHSLKFTDPTSMGSSQKEDTSEKGHVCALMRLKLSHLVQIQNITVGVHQIQPNAEIKFQ